MLSVITPVYNGERFIESCIEVVVNQKCSEVEHLIIDGGSTDRTIDIIKQYADRYPHIRWISEKDQGQSDAMNKGIRMSKGEILAFLNVDDYYELGVLNRVLDIFKSLPEPTLLVGNCNIWDDNDILIAINKPTKIKFLDLLIGYEKATFPVNPSAYFYHKCIHKEIGLYDINHHYIMDIDFILKATRVANVNYIDEVWGNFRRIEGTKTASNFSENRHQVRKLLIEHRKYLPLNQRIYVGLSHEFYRNKQRINYFYENPTAIIDLIRKKILGHSL